MDALRAEVDRMRTASPANGIEVRVTMSARHHVTLFDVRCTMREQLIGFIQQRYPGALPTTRIKAPAFELHAERALTAGSVRPPS